MEFLDQVYFDNTVRSYLVVAGTILFVLLVKKYLSRYVVSLVYKMAKRVWAELDRQSFLGLVAEPVEWFLVIMITIFTLDKLHYPEALKFDIYGHSINDILARIGPGIMVVTFIWLLLRLIDFIAVVLKEKANIANDTRDNQLIVFFRDFLKVIVGICGVLLIIKASFHQPIGNVLTGLSLVGAGLALAAKESLENLIASFIIFFDKPFFTGDVVKVNAVTGTVERIGLRSTRIRTGDKTLVTVPNKQMVDSVVDNWSLRTERRAEIKLELSSQTKVDIIERLVVEMKTVLSGHNEQINNFSIFVNSITRDSIIITTEYFTQPFAMSEFARLRSDINLQVKKLIEQGNIEFAGNAGNVIVRNEDNNTDG